MTSRSTPITIADSDEDDLFEPLEIVTARYARAASSVAPSIFASTSAIARPKAHAVAKPKLAQPTHLVASSNGAGTSVIRRQQQQRVNLRSAATAAAPTADERDDLAVPRDGDDRVWYNDYDSEMLLRQSVSERTHPAAPPALAAAAAADCYGIDADVDDEMQLAMAISASMAPATAPPPPTLELDWKRGTFKYPTSPTSSTSKRAVVARMTVLPVSEVKAKAQHRAMDALFAATEDLDDPLSSSGSDRGRQRRHRAASTVPGLRSGSPMWRACSPDARGADWTSSRAPPTVSLLSSSASSGSEAENEPPPPLPLAGRVEKRRRDEQVKSLRDQFIGGSTAGPIDALLDLHGAPAALRDEIRRSVTDQLARMWDDIADRLAPSGVRSEPATQNGWAFPPPTVQERRPPLPLAPRSAARDPPLAPLPLYATPAPTASLSFSSALTESTSLDRNRYNKMRLIELKTLAKTAGVKVSGTKDQVIDRLLDHGNSIHLLSSLSIEGSAEAPKRNGNAQVQVLQWIKSHADIYDRVLMFDPLDLDEIHSQLGADGIRIGKPALVSLFDEHSIIHSAKSNGRWGRA